MYLGIVKKMGLTKRQPNPPGPTLAQLRVHSRNTQFDKMNRFIQFVYALLIISASSPFIAASTPSAAQPLLDLQARILALKKAANKAVKDSGLGDLIRIGGYLNTLSGLELGSITSYPVAELSFYLANLGLIQNIVNIVSQVLYVAGNSNSLAGGLISLQIARQACPACPLLADPRVDTSIPLHSGLDSVISNIDPMQVKSLIDSTQTSAYDLANVLVVSGGINSLLDLTSNLLSSNQASLQALNSNLESTVDG